MLLPSAQTQHDTHARLPALQDSPLDLGPFSLEPDQLASLLDPKDLDALQALGGIASILDGLGTHLTRGLLLDRGVGRPSTTLGVVRGASQTRDSHECGSFPNIPDDPHGGNDLHGAPDPHTASMADRKAYTEGIFYHTVQQHLSLRSRTRF